MKDEYRASLTVYPNFKCTQQFQHIPINAIVEVVYTPDMDIYINYNGKAIKTNYATLRSHFEKVE